ncbi:hypothetical protein KDN24_06605 [Bacillus sp. Bva_UNVM-123]|uniref:hypothetical protein n=1 Tax=Bacillus sp. Bva_UNVM-123 TaxID=2829798 RepID=UPI00391EEA05
MKTIIFKYQRDFSGHDVVVEEVEFDDDATEQEINDEFANWMIEQICDSCSWCEKEDS